MQQLERRFWTTVEVKAIRADRSAAEIARELGRTEKSVKCKADALGVKLRRSRPYYGRPQRVVERAKSLRADGWPLSRISESTGIPFGTLRNWIYSGHRCEVAQ